MNEKEDDSLKELVNTIGEFAKNQQKLAQQALPGYQAKVENIIYYNVTDENTIEHTLDFMLDFCFDDDILKEFKRLLRYYIKYNEQAVDDYVRYYREQWDNDYDRT